MIQTSLMAMFLPIVLGGIGGLNGGDFGGRLRNQSPNTMSTNTGSSGNSNVMPGSRPLTVSPPPRRYSHPEFLTVSIVFTKLTLFKHSHNEFNEMKRKCLHFLFQYLTVDDEYFLG